jgi:hypothetical protein
VKKPADSLKTPRQTPDSSPRSRYARSPEESALPRPVAAAKAPSAEAASSHWTFLTNHAHVLVLLARNASLVLREVALQVGITERAVQRIIADLEAGGVIEREKIGRQNHYRIRTNQPLRHPIESHRTIGELLALLGQRAR